MDKLIKISSTPWMIFFWKWSYALFFPKTGAIFFHVLFQSIFKMTLATLAIIYAEKLASEVEIFSRNQFDSGKANIFEIFRDSIFILFREYF